MYCIHCGHNQREGKFCAGCGNALGGVVDGTVQPVEMVGVRSRSQPNDYTKKMKKQLNLYWNYLLKHPADAFKREEKDFINGVVTIGILAILVGLSMFTILKEVETHSFSVIGNVAAYVVSSVAIVLGSLYLTTKFLGPEQSIKKLISMYAAHLIPSAFLVLIAFAFLLLKIFTFGNVLLITALLLAFFIVPLYILTKLVTQEKTIIDPYYSLVVYVVVVGIVSFICLAIFGDAVMGNIMLK
ncbi:hypothetical protein [Sporosarcina sp. NPDC096371]|uniref:hypothetical protein n=1 Tax=Sporosarcina sp. NPDC096371 TaxID=3364530 RepID=UPI0037FDA08E